MLNSLIVYVEDSEDDVFFLKKALDQTKHQGGFVHLATIGDAKAHFEKAAASKEIPGLIMVDLHIGVDSGKELVEFIRSFEVFRTVPVVMLSGSYVFEDLDKAYETGANLFLIKPQDLRGWTELVFKIRDYFPPALS
jgi:CheY-like chemotaxis protein